MSKYVFKDKNLHYITRFSVIFIIAPYLLYTGFLYKDIILLILGSILLIFDTMSVMSDNNNSNIHQWGRLAGLLIVAPVIYYAGMIYNDNILKILAIGTAIADGYTFYLGERS